MPGKFLSRLTESIGSTIKVYSDAFSGLEGAVESVEDGVLSMRLEVLHPQTGQPLVNPQTGQRHPDVMVEVDVDSIKAISWLLEDEVEDAPLITIPTAGIIDPSAPRG